MKARPPIRVNLAARAANAEIRRQKTRAKLIEAGLSVLADKGLTASIEDYAAAAGVARGTFYNYFPTSNDLMRAVRLEILKTISDELRQHLKAATDPAARFAMLSLFFIDFARRHPTKAWATLHLDRLQPNRMPGDRDIFEAILRKGVGTGRFRPVELGPARSVWTGALRMALHDTLTAAPPPSHGETMIVLMLTALGLDHDEATAIVRSVADGQTG